MTSNKVTDDLKVVLGHLRRTLRSLADEVRPVAPGLVMRTRSLPRVWSLNQVRITQVAEFSEVLGLATRYQADLLYRHVVEEAQPPGSVLASSFAAAGWKVEREVLMILQGSSVRKVDTSPVVELSEAQSLELMRRWNIEDYPDIGDGLEELQEYSRREGRLWGEHCFGILDRDGRPIAITKLRSDGSVAWVEDVYTVPEARGRGHARKLVTYATGLARTSRHGLIFIVADDNDWPQHLYADIGFRPVGKIGIFHKEPDPLPFVP